MAEHVADVDKKYFERFIERIDFHGGDISVESLRSLHSRHRRTRDLLPRAAAGRVRGRGRDDRQGRPRRRDRRVAPARHREAVRHRPRFRARAQRAAAPLLARGPDLPHRPLPRQGDGAEHLGVPVREPLRRTGAARRARRRDPDHGRGDARGRRPLALLRRHRRAARHDPEPPHPDDDDLDDGAARVVGRGDDPRPQGRGVEGGSARSTPRATRCVASTPPVSSTGSRWSGTAPSRASTRPRAPRRSRPSGCISTRGGGKACPCCCVRASGSRRRRTRSRSASRSRRRGCSGTRRSSTRTRTGSCSG